MIHEPPLSVDIEVTVESATRRETVDFSSRADALVHVAELRSDRPNEKIIVRTTEVFQ